MWYIYSSLYSACRNELQKNFSLSLIFNHWFHLKVLNHMRYVYVQMFIKPGTFYDVKCRLSVVPFEKLRAMGIKSYIMYFFIIFLVQSRFTCYGQIKALAFRHFVDIHWKKKSVSFIFFLIFHWKKLFQT